MTDSTPASTVDAHIDGWQRFASEGIEGTATGIVYRTGHMPCCGVPLGGLGTGCLDLDPNGVLGFSSIFHGVRRVTDPRYQPTWRAAASQLPFLGLAAGGEVWVLASEPYLRGGVLTGCTEPGMNRDLVENQDWIDAWSAPVPAVHGVRGVRGIEYWGHYPFADLRYQTDSPVAVSMRAWAPFVPGDSVASNTPAAIFEVTLVNQTDLPQSCTLAMSFPGPTEAEAGGSTFLRESVGETASGIAVSATGAELSYVLATDAEFPVRTGAGLHRHPESWSRIARELPDAPTESIDGSAAVATDLTLAPGEQRTVRYFLCWYAPVWEGGGYPDIVNFEKWYTGPYPPPHRETQDGHRYRSQYSTRYADARQVLEQASRCWPDWRRRALAAQSAIYSATELPDWLQDVLVNSLAVLTEDSYWAAPDPVLGDWAAEHGAFGLVESPRGCAVMGCIVSNWYGDLPLLYLFPELERAILRNYTAYQRPDGAMPFLYPNGDWTRATYEWLLPLNGFCFVDLVHRLWRRLGDDSVLSEFYDAVKSTTAFSMTLQQPPLGVVGVHRVGVGQEWWEHTPVRGIVPHAAGLKLAQLQMAAGMADARGDEEFAAQCRQWFDDGRTLLEETSWRERGYCFYVDPASGDRCDDILSSQLDGDWASFSHGYGGVFDRARATVALDTIAAACLTDYGLAGFANPDGSPQLDAYGSFTAEMTIVGMTYLYHGQRERGMEIVRRNFDNVFRRQAHPWDLPNMVVCSSGLRSFGTDYFQMLSVWGMPAALAGTDLSGPCASGGLIARVLSAAG